MLIRLQRVLGEDVTGIRDGCLIQNSADLITGSGKGIDICQNKRSDAMVLADEIGNTADHAAAYHDFINGDIMTSAAGAAGNL